MASSSSNTSSASSSSSTTSGAAAAASTALAGAPGANASSPAHALGVAPPTATAPAPGVPPAAVDSASALNVPTESTATLGASRRRSEPRSKPRSVSVPVIDFFAHADWSGTGVRAPTSAGVSGSASASDHAPVLSYQQQWPALGADPPANPAPAHPKGGLGENSDPVMKSTEEGSSSSASAPFPSSYTVGSAPTVTTPASAATSSTTLVPSAPTASAPAVETSAHTAPKKDAPTSSPPVVLKTVNTKLRAEAPPFKPSSATGAVMAPAPGAAPTASATIFSVNRIPATPLYSHPMWARSCCDCGHSPAEPVAARCVHYFVLCAGCYNNRFVCPFCGVRYR